MSGYVLCMSACVVCRKTFSFNPHRVPSTSAFTGKREPVCRGCMDEINQRRAERGLPEHFIYPDAYEALPESEL